MSRKSGRKAKPKPKGPPHRWTPEEAKAHAAQGGKTMAGRREEMVEIGRRGGEATKQRRGPEHFAKAGRASGQARRRQRDQEADDAER